ncbi:MAG: hypothetical protein AB3N09_14105 [Tateyamaria sp.]
MADALTPDQRAFLQKYLGAGTGDSASAPVLSIWRDAKDKVDDDLNKLQSALKSSNDPLLERIAEIGLHSVTEGRMSKMQAALMDANGSADANVRGKARAAISEMRSFVEGNPVLGLLDENPFGIDVSLRATLGDVLTKLDAQLGG